MFSAIFGWLFRLGGGGLIVLGCFLALIGGCGWYNYATKTPVPQYHSISGDPSPTDKRVDRSLEKVSKALADVEGVHRVATKIMLGVGLGMLVLGSLGIKAGNSLLD